MRPSQMIILIRNLILFQIQTLANGISNIEPNQMQTHLYVFKYFISAIYKRLFNF